LLLYGTKMEAFDDDDDDDDDLNVFLCWFIC
nr:hypothetical protein [Tanacetum cinerariifolium]